MHHNPSPSLSFVSEWHPFYCSIVWNMNFVGLLLPQHSWTMGSGVGVAHASVIFDNYHCFFFSFWNSYFYLLLILICCKICLPEFINQQHCTCTETSFMYHSNKVMKCDNQHDQVSTEQHVNSCVLKNPWCTRASSGSHSNIIPSLDASNQETCVTNIVWFDRIFFLKFWLWLLYYMLILCLLCLLLNKDINYY